MSDINLLPCPCCGATAITGKDAEYENSNGEPAVECSACNVMSWTADDWNRRAAVEADRQGRMQSDEEINVAGMPEFDDLMDHIYEYGTASEGVLARADRFARALLSRYSSGQPVASAEADREKLMHAIVEAGQRAGIIRADLETASVTECLHILECLSQPAASAEPCFCDRMYPDSNPAATCGDCPRDYQPAASAEPPKLTDDEIERLVSQLGATWTDDAWKIEDADLHPMVRALLYRYTAAPVAQEPVAWVRIDEIQKLPFMLHAGKERPRAIGNWVPVYTAPVAAQAQHPDDAAVDRFAAAMKDKLAQARAKGRHGWREIDPSDLSMMLRSHVEKGDPRDVANFCCFLWSLGKPISAGGVEPMLGTPVAQEPVAFLCRECDEEGWSTYVVMPHEVPSTGEFLHVEPLYDAPVAAQAQPTMPPLTDAMRAVLRNEHDVYGDEDALYAVLCDAASLNHFPGATKMVSAESVSGADQAQPVAEVVGRQRLENESGSAVPRIAALDMNLQPGQLLYTCPTAAQAQPVVNQSTEREAFEFWASDEGEYPTAVERDGNGNYKLAQIQSHWEAWQARAALAQQPSGQSQRQPDGYAYRYRSTFGDGTVIRFNRGEEVNGSLPIDAVPFWYAPPDCAQDREDAQRWRYMRRKLCLTGNGNGTCAMQAINLPVAIPGWPEPGQVAEFCDTAIDAAIANDRAAAKERT